MFWFILVVGIIILIFVSENNKNKMASPPPSIPFPLNCINFVQVDYLNWRNRNDTGTLVYSGTVSWSEPMNCWEIFIDSCTFADKMIEKKSITFLDANKNIVSMQGFNYSTEDIIEGDCGRVKIWKST